MQTTLAEQKFNIGALTGISAKNIEEHLKLYAGYVKHFNLISEKISALSADLEKNGFELTELQRRLSFEFNGVRNHEIFFASLAGGEKQIEAGSALHKKISAQWGSFDQWLALFKQTAKTRGIGWAMLGYDSTSQQLINYWVDEQHLGQLNGVQPVLALDMWEHSFVSDYFPSGKPNYINDFFANLNWAIVEDNYNRAVK